MVCFTMKNTYAPEPLLTCSQANRCFYEFFWLQTLKFKSCLLWKHHLIPSTWPPSCRRRAPLQTKPPAACPPGRDWTQKIQRTNNLSKSLSLRASLHFCIITLPWLQDSTPFMRTTPLFPAKPYLSGLYFHLPPTYIHRPRPKHIALTPIPFCSPNKCHVPKPLLLTCCPTP